MKSIIEIIRLYREEKKLKNDWEERIKPRVKETLERNRRRKQSNSED